MLPCTLLQISQSKSFKLAMDHLKLTPNGMVKLFMKNGSSPIPSRVYLKLSKKGWTMKKYILSTSLGVSIGTIISSSLQSILDPGNVSSHQSTPPTMGAYYLAHFTQTTVMLICVVVWARNGHLYFHC